MLPHAVLIIKGNKTSRSTKVGSLLKTLLPEYAQKLDHPDLHILKVREGSKNISISQIRDLIKTLHKKPFSAKSKVAVIYNANLMTREAQNAFLKTLEEPPKNSFIILETQNPSQLLPTIISRCYKIKLPPKALVEINSDEHIKYGRAFLKLVFENRGKRLSWVEGNKSDIKNPEFTLQLLNTWESLLRDLLLYNIGLKKEIVNKQIINQTSQKLNKLSKNQITESIKRLEYTKTAISQYNATPRLALENFLINLMKDGK